MKQPKQRIDIFVEQNIFDMLVSYGEIHQCKNMTQVINNILVEWRRFKAIALKLQEHDELKRMDELKNAEVVKL